MSENMLPEKLQISSKNTQKQRPSKSFSDIKGDDALNLRGRLPYNGNRNSSRDAGLSRNGHRTPSEPSHSRPSSPFRRFDPTEYIRIKERRLGEMNRSRSMSREREISAERGRKRSCSQFLI